jgi:AcrR family transcriptional regulator
MYVPKHILADIVKSAPSVRTRQRDRQATEHELVSAAAAVFAEKGYENATTRGIAEAAGCSEGLIQRYFNGKEGLLLAVLKHEGSTQRDRFLDRPLCASMVDEAREMLQHGAEILQQRSERIRIVLSRALIDRAFQADFQRISTRQDAQRGLKQRLARYVEAGMIDPAMDLDVVTELLMGLVFQLGFVHRELHQTKPADIARMREGMAMLFARAVAVPAVALSTAASTASSSKSSDKSSNKSSITPSVALDVKQPVEPSVKKGARKHE